MKVIRLADKHSEALEELLRAQPRTNLFLIGYADATPLSRAHWYGAIEEDTLHGVVLIVPNRLAVPWCPAPDLQVSLGAYLRWRHRPCMMVGPREHCDGIWVPWSQRARTHRFYDQRLYICTEPVPGEPLQGFRRARAEDMPTIAAYADAMEFEDLGTRPRQADPTGFDQGIQRRIEEGATWVWEQDGEIVFQIHVGTRTADGAQVGGTYVPPKHRGQGLATLGMQELTRRLLPKAGCITLHVNEANTPAVRTYERAGFVRDAPYRLLTLPP